MKYVVLAVVLGIALFLLWGSDSAPPKVRLADTHPEEYMKSIQAKSFSETGELKNALVADSWAFLPKEHLSKFQNPYLTVHKTEYKTEHKADINTKQKAVQNRGHTSGNNKNKPNKSVWHVSSKQGHAIQPTLAKIEAITLEDTVVLERPKTQETEAIKIETHSLSYNPEKEYAKTDEHVTLTKPDLTITGVGLNAYLEDSWVELLHNVKTVFVPKKEKSANSTSSENQSKNSENQSKNQDVIIIQSDSAEFDDKKGTAKYYDHVVMDQGSRHLTSDRLTIERNQQGKIGLMVALGYPAQFEEQKEASKSFGHANILKYYPNDEKIILLEDAELTQQEKTIRSEHLTYFLNSGLLTAAPKPGSRTTIIIPRENAS